MRRAKPLTPLLPIEEPPEAEVDQKKKKVDDEKTLLNNMTNHVDVVAED